MRDEIVNLIEKFIKGEISPEEKFRLRQWYNTESINEKLFSEYYNFHWQQALEHPDSSANESRLRVWNNLCDELIGKKTIHRSWLKVAGVAIIAVLSTLLGFGLSRMINHAPDENLVVRVENGQKAQIQLPDGSSVWLNSASEISYPSHFGQKNRTLKLKGEAYFEVKSDLGNPFIVQTWTGLNIKALGTKFNVKSYDNDKQITGTLLEGKIEVSYFSFSEILQPNERIIFKTTTNTFEKTRVQSSEEAIFWLTDQFVFDGETLEDITKILQRMYNVSFVFSSPELKQIQYSGKINNNSMENVLSLITTVSPLRYTINDSIITFSEK
ncbi:MAG: FecR family protein [Bacteroidia bacterium]|nr:FecR family protein [Bacteroidia bacterium]